MTRPLHSDAFHKTPLSDHTGDTTDAHDASAISILDAANDFTATDVEGALAELQSDAEADATALSDHIADTSDAHDASAISIADAGAYYTSTEVEGALQEIGAGGIGGGGGIGEILISDTPSTPLVFADLIQNEAQTDLVYADP